MKTIYEKLEYELLKYYVNGQGSGNKINNLTKIKLEAYDDTLKVGIDDIIIHLKEASRLRTIKMYQKSSIEMQIANNLMQQLAAYCRERINSNEPEWMIVARKHGWRPPN